MPKTAWQSDLLLQIDKASDTTLSRQIYREIARSILGKRLLPGARLPSARQLSRDLGVSRNTVEGAFDRLAAEGYVERAVGSGSFVSTNVRVQSVLDGQPTRVRQRAPRLSPARGRYANAVLAVDSRETGARCIGDPAIDAFPIASWKRLMARQLSRLSATQLGYADSGGYQPLRDAIADYLARTRQMSVSPDRVIVVAGAQQALDLTSRLLLDSADRVLFEEPGYLGARAAFLAAGATLCPVEVDDEGIAISSLPKKDRAARLAYVTPAHQFPLGPTLSLARRLALLEWARAANAWIVEDDYDGEFRHAGSPLSSLASLDKSGRVLYIGTFSKIMFPALRLGFFVVPENLLTRALPIKRYMDRFTPLLEQATLAAFMREGYFARHIAKMRGLYAERRRDLLLAIQKHAQDLVDVVAPETGVHVIVRLRARIPDAIAASAVQTCGLAAMPLSSYYLKRGRTRGLIVSFANLHDADAVVSRAAEALRRL
ncbi:MAG: PLP-dependent aminotransferase family protein [Candidatus Tyrphobacter sp.]